VVTIEFDDSLGQIWKLLRTATPLDGFNYSADRGNARNNSFVAEL
jgi:hypothetical protein